MAAVDALDGKTTPPKPLRPLPSLNFTESGHRLSAGFCVFFQYKAQIYRRLILVDLTPCLRKADSGLESSNPVNGKCSGAVSVGKQFPLHLGDAVVQHIDIPKDAHGIRHGGITVVVDVREVFRAGLAVQSAVVGDFNTVWILVESHWRIAITSDDQRLVCFLLMQGLEPEDICKRLKISRERYDLIVAETAIEMRNFGLAPEDWPEDDEVED